MFWEESADQGLNSSKRINMLGDPQPTMTSNRTQLFCPISWNVRGNKFKHPRDPSEQRLPDLHRRTLGLTALTVLIRTMKR